MIIIGEKINATRKSIKEAILAKDREVVKTQIEEQDKAGADYIDLNAGTGSGDEAQEKEDMKWLIDIALDTTEKKLGIDSANPEVICSSAQYLDNRRPWLINSLKKEGHIMDTLLKLGAQNDVPIVALAMDEEGIPATSEARLEVCRKITEAANKTGVSTSNLFFDPLVMPLSSDYKASMVTFRTMDAIKREIPEAKLTMGLSNVSFGLVKRPTVNQAFMIAAISHGLDSAICDPTKQSIRDGIYLGEAIGSKDKHCRRFVRAVRTGKFGKKKKKKKTSS